MSQQPPNKPFNPVSDQIWENMKRNTAAFKKDFLALEDENIRNIPVGIFRRDFLPMFAGRPIANYDDMKAMWFIIAGTAYQPVNVVDDSGQFLIQIPPFLEATAINPSPIKEGPGLGALMDDAMGAAVNVPRLGDNLVQNALGGRMQRVEVPTTPSAAWQKVFDYFQIIPGREDVQQVETKPGKATPSGDSDFEM